MFRLNAPHYSVSTVFANCITRTEDMELRNALLLERPRVLTRCHTYAHLASSMHLSDLAPQAPVNLIHEDLSGVYERVLVDGGERYVYLGIRGAAPYNRCPLCAHRDVATLDHYLPKENYPEFAVLPANLVPCCTGCNGAKRTYIPNSVEEQLFHPYFDDWSSHDLLIAHIYIGAYIDVTFEISVVGIPTSVAARASEHFHRLQLRDLYSSNAAAELVAKRLDFEITFQSGGAEALRMDLEREASIRRLPFKNAWQPALYSALASCPSFWQGAYSLIETPIPL